jgi:hypothetical protein
VVFLSSDVEALAIAAVLTPVNAERSCSDIDGQYIDQLKGTGDVFRMNLTLRLTVYVYKYLPTLVDRVNSTRS